MGAGESKEEEKEATASEEASTALAVGASLGLAAGAIYSLLTVGSSNTVSNGKLMKARGQKGVTIPRDGFQDNPKDYFRRLCKNAETGARVGLAAGAIYSSLASGSSNSVSNEKMMKAPGQNGVTIRRNDFEDNPKGYFSDLRKGKGNSNSNSNNDKMAIRSRRGHERNPRGK